MGLVNGNSVKVRSDKSLRISLFGHLVIVSLIASLLGCGVTFAASPVEDSLARSLSARHFDGDVAKLEQIAGSRDALVSALIALRTNDSLPFVGIRAERLLVQFSDRDDARAALLQDLGSAKYKGLARAITVHLDKAPTPAARKVLGDAAATRAKSDPEFKPYLKHLLSSKDPELRRIARDIGE